MNADNDPSEWREIRKMCLEASILLVQVAEESTHQRPDSPDDAAALRWLQKLRLNLGASLGMASDAEIRAAGYVGTRLVN